MLHCNIFNTEKRTELIIAADFLEEHGFLFAAWQLRDDVLNSDTKLIGQHMLNPYCFDRFGFVFFPHKERDDQRKIRLIKAQKNDGSVIETNFMHLDNFYPKVTGMILAYLGQVSDLEHRISQSGELEVSWLMFYQFLRDNPTR